MKPVLRVIANRPVLEPIHSIEAHQMERRLDAEVDAEDQQDRVLATANRLFAYMVLLAALACAAIAWWWLR